MNYHQVSWNVPSKFFKKKLQQQVCFQSSVMNSILATAIPNLLLYHTQDTHVILIWNEIKLSTALKWNHGFLKEVIQRTWLMKRWRKLYFRENGSKRSKGSKGVPFVVTYHPSLNYLSRIIKNKLNILYMSPEAEAAFSPGPMVSFRSARKLSRYSVRAKLYLLERLVGLRQCKKRTCEVCTNLTETDTFSSVATGETFQINCELNCDGNCFNYLLKCKVCKKQYVEETADAFRLRWNNWKENDREFQRNESCMQQYLYEHFYSEGHNGLIRLMVFNLRKSKIIGW